MYDVFAGYLRYTVCISNVSRTGGGLGPVDGRLLYHSMRTLWLMLPGTFTLFTT